MSADLAATRAVHTADRGVLATRVGRRFVLLFLGAALLPLLAFAAISLHHVSRHLTLETERTLHNGAKTAGMGVAARLSQAVGDLRLVGAALANPELRPGAAATGVLSFLSPRFRGLWWQHAEATQALIGAALPDLPPLDAAQQRHLDAGSPLLATLPRQSDLVLLLRDPAPHLRGHTLVGVLRGDWLWNLEELRIPVAEVAVFDRSGQWLAGTPVERPDPAPLLAAAQAQPASGSLVWALAGEAHLARYWRVFLQPQYGIDLLIVQSRATGEAMAVAHGFERWFLLTSALALLIVLVIALAQMRRLLKPLLHIRDATRQVGSGDYATRVAIESRDEFGELAAAFNQMTGEIAENIRRRTETERELVASRDAALAAVRAKSDFVTNVSHEFRTPMAEILSAAEILTEIDDLDLAAREEFGAMALSGARRLARMIDDVLELGCSVPWELEACDVGTSLRNAVAMTSPERRRRIEIEVADDLPPVAAVSHRLIDIWLRLLDNAAKFSAAEAPILLRARAEAGQAVVEITDRGCGISRLDLQQIFEPFQQVGRDQLTDKAQGAGMGLSIVRNTVERLGGTIEVDSELGAGSTFTVRLPVLVAVPAMVAAPAQLVASADGSL